MSDRQHIAPPAQGVAVHGCRAADGGLAHYHVALYRVGLVLADMLLTPKDVLSLLRMGEGALPTPGLAPLRYAPSLDPSLACAPATIGLIPRADRYLLASERFGAGIELFIGTRSLGRAVFTPRAFRALLYEVWPLGAWRAFACQLPTQQQTSERPSSLNEPAASAVQS